MKLYLLLLLLLLLAGCGDQKVVYVATPFPASSTTNAGATITALSLALTQAQATKTNPPTNAPSATSTTPPTNTATAGVATNTPEPQQATTIPTPIPRITLPPTAEPTATAGCVTFTADEQQFLIAATYTANVATLAIDDLKTGTSNFTEAGKEQFAQQYVDRGKNTLIDIVKVGRSSPATGRFVSLNADWQAALDEYNYVSQAPDSEVKMWGQHLSLGYELNSSITNKAQKAGRIACPFPPTPTP